MSNARRRVWVCVVLAVLAVLLAFGVACESGPDVTWVNQTDQTVLVYLRDEFRRDLGTPLPPHSSRIELVTEFVWEDVIVIRDEQGNVLFRQELTWDALKAQRWRFVITEDMLSPTPTEGR